jgi:hypothetical protein
MADHEPPGYDDWFDDPEPPTMESGRANRPSYDTPGQTEEDVWVLPEDEARRARRSRGRGGEIVIGGKALTSTQVAIIAIAGLAVIVALIAAFGGFSPSKKATLPTTGGQSTNHTTTTNPATHTYKVPTVTLQLNDTNTAQVKILEKDLKALGFYAGAIDGGFGAGVQSAVEQFQQSQGLSPVDGIVGKATRNKLRSALAALSGG